MRQPITTPNAAEEFMRSLDQHPEIEQELRRRLLTQELLDLPNMDLLELLRKRGIEGDVDFLREALQVLVESIMDAEVSAQIGAQHGERNPDRLTHRNGYRNRAWDTRVGTTGLNINGVARSHRYHQRGPPVVSRVNHSSVRQQAGRIIVVNHVLSGGSSSSGRGSLPRTVGSSSSAPSTFR